MRYMVPGNASKPLSQMRRGAIEYCVLAVLATGEQYGYEMAKTLAEADGLVTSEGTLYPLLARLREEGLVETTWRESSQGPPRRYYQLTKDGQLALEAFVDQWTRFKNAVDRLLKTGETR
jgi:PadR family transcriptional regulator PadR